MYEQKKEEKPPNEAAQQNNRAFGQFNKFKNEPEKELKERELAIEINKKGEEEKAASLLINGTFSHMTEIILAFTINSKEHCKEILEKMKEKEIKINDDAKTYLEMIAKGESEEKIGQYCASQIIKRLNEDFAGGLIRAIGYGRSYDIQTSGELLNSILMKKIKRNAPVDNGIKDILGWLLLIISEKTNNEEIKKQAEQVIITLESSKTKEEVFNEIKNLINKLDTAQKKESERNAATITPKVQQEFTGKNLFDEVEISEIKKVFDNASRKEREELIEQIKSNDQLVVKLFFDPEIKMNHKYYLVRNANEEVRSKIAKKIFEEKIDINTYPKDIIKLISKEDTVDFDSKIKSKPRQKEEKGGKLQEAETAKLEKILIKVLFNFDDLLEKEKEEIIMALGRNDGLYEQIFFNEKIGMRTKSVAFLRIKDQKVRESIKKRLEEQQKPLPLWMKEILNAQALREDLKIKPPSLELIKKIYQYKNLTEKERLVLQRYIDKQTTQPSKMEEEIKKLQEKIKLLVKINKELYSKLDLQEKDEYLEKIIKENFEQVSTLKELGIISNEDLDNYVEKIEQKIKQLSEIQQKLKLNK